MTINEIRGLYPQKTNRIQRKKKYTAAIEPESVSKKRNIPKDIVLTAGAVAGAYFAGGYLLGYKPKFLTQATAKTIKNLSKKRYSEDATIHEIIGKRRDKEALKAYQACLAEKKIKGLTQRFHNGEFFTKSDEAIEKILQNNTKYIVEISRKPEFRL